MSLGLDVKETDVKDLLTLYHGDIEFVLSELYRT